MDSEAYTMSQTHLSNNLHFHCTLDSFLCRFVFFPARRIYSTTSASYDYTSQQIYVMDFKVDDGTDVSNTGYALLYITKNDPPKITNLGRK